MKIECNKELLIDLVSSVSPNYELFNSPFIEPFGVFDGFYGCWSWYNDKLEECSLEQLLEMYKLCKSSWCKN